MTARLPTFLAALAVAAAPAAAVRAQASDPAVSTVSSLNDALLGAMRMGGTASGREKRLEPAVESAFDFPAMMRFAVGPSWSGLPAAQQQALIRAFARFSAATYAHNFDNYSGERFTVDPNVQTKGPDKLVKSQLVPKSGGATTFLYRMRQSGGRWKIVDVFFNGSISELASQASDFRSTLASGGAPALVKKLDDKADALLR